MILRDIVMPVDGGYEFLERPHQDGGIADIPIVLVSATHALPDAANDLGVRAVLTKPFDMGMPLARVDRLARQG